MRLKVLGPDVNESDVNFAVNRQGAIRFALTALKGVGSAAVEELVRERTANGPFKSIFDVAKRVNTRSVNRKAYEGLAYGGGFDCFTDIHRAQYFFESNAGDSIIDRAIKYGNQMQASSSSMQHSLFGGGSMEAAPEPNIPKCEEWNLMDKLNKEKEVTGIYISGHPLDDYTREIQTFTTCRLADIDNMKGKTFKIAGIVTETMSMFDKLGNKYGRFTLEDFTGSKEFMLFKQKYLDFKKYIDEPGSLLFLHCNYKLSRWKEGEYEIDYHRL